MSTTNKQDNNTLRRGSNLTPRQSTQSSSSSSSLSSQARTLPSVPSDTNRLLFLSIFPAILLIGCSYSAIATRSLPYNHDLQSFAPEHAPSYFALKSNVLNVYFVKFGWVWMTAAIASFVYTYPFAHYARQRPGPTRDITNNRTHDNRTNKKTDDNHDDNNRGNVDSHVAAATTVRLVSQIFVRWSLVTITWIIVTQWFFGPALIDRSFQITGGSCVAHFVPTSPADISFSSPDMAIAVNPSAPSTFQIEAFSRQACRTAGGSWSHGHDISGHVFLLVSGSAMLLLEMLPYLNHWLTAYPDHTSERSDNTTTSIKNGGASFGDDNPNDDSAFRTVRTIHSSAPTTSNEVDRIGYGADFALVVVCTSLWMIFATSMYFHTWVEKLSGLLVALGGIWLVYFFPAKVFLLQTLIGTPGV